MKIALIKGGERSKIAESLAKKVAQEYYLNKGIHFSQENLKIVKDVFGKPKIKFPNGDLNLSISHSDRYAIAEVSDKGQIGIDIESVREFSPKFLVNFLNQEELDHLNKVEKSQANMWATLLWSIKESYLKALGVGLRKHPKKINVQFLGQKTLISSPFSKKIATAWYKMNHQKGYVITKVII